MNIKAKILIIVSIFSGNVYAANLENKLMVFSDLHFSQQRDEIAFSLNPLINDIKNYHPEVKNWLGLGDIISISTDIYGPFSKNVSDLENIFSSNGYTFHSVCGNHDTSGASLADMYSIGANIYVARNWAWDVSQRWRVLAFETLYGGPGYIFTSDQLSWLAAQLVLAESEEKNIIIATHEELAGDYVWERTMTISPSSVSGTTEINSSASVFTVEDVGKTIYIKENPCTADDETCWGYATVLSVNSPTNISVNVTNEFVSTSPTITWGFATELNNSRQVLNSSTVRGILEDHNTVVKLILNGHRHENSTWTVNGLEYRSLGSAQTYSGCAACGAKTSAIVYLYSDGSWAMAGIGRQTSYNWQEIFLSSSGLSTNGGSLPDDAVDIATLYNRIQPGYSVKVVDNISGITAKGTSDKRISISPYQSRINITTGIVGEYLDVNNVSFSPIHVIATNQSNISRIKTP